MQILRSSYCKHISTKPIFIFITFLLLFVSCKQTNEELYAKAYTLTKENKFVDAIKVYTEIIKANKKMQKAFYERGYCFAQLKDYTSALRDFNDALDLKMVGELIFTPNAESPFAKEEDHYQVAYFDIIYQRAQANYYIDSTKSAFQDFQILVDNNFNERSNCILWQGAVLVKEGKLDKACKYLEIAKQAALSEYDKQEANKMLITYCIEKNKNH